MKRILFLNGSGVGGAEMMTILYSNILQNAGYECKILTHCSPEDTIQSVKLISTRILHKEITCRFRKYPFYVFQEIWAFHPDIVFAWDFHEVKYILNQFRKFCITPNFKLVCRCPNTPSVMDPTECSGFKAYKYANLVIAQTKEMESELSYIVGIDPKKIITIYNPINKERIIQNLKENYIFDKSFINYVAVGRISKQKDYSTMLRAFSLVLKKQPRSRLYICGRETDRQLNEILKSIINNNGMQQAVFFEGFQSNPHKYIKNADVFVLSSIYEGLPNAMLEAMYLGVPVVATSCIPFIDQVIHNGENGYTCPIDTPQILAEVMIKAHEIKNLPKYIDPCGTEKQVVAVFNKL